MEEYTKRKHKQVVDAVQSLLTELLRLAGKHRIRRNGGVIEGRLPTGAVLRLRINPISRRIRYAILDYGRDQRVVSIQFNPQTSRVADSTKFDRSDHFVTGHIQIYHPYRTDEQAVQEARNHLYRAQEWKK